MRYRTLGKTGLEVSEIGFGAEWIGKMDDETVRAIAKTALDGGVNIVDCWMADPAIRAKLYAACERASIGMTVMKGFAGGRLLDAEKSPFGVAMTPA